MSGRSVGIDRAAVRETFVLKLVISGVVCVTDTLNGLAGVSRLEPLTLLLFGLVLVVGCQQDFPI